jgi:hypothetical protein
MDTLLKLAKVEKKRNYARLDLGTATAAHDITMHACTNKRFPEARQIAVSSLKKSAASHSHSTYSS